MGKTLNILVMFKNWFIRLILVGLGGRENALDDKTSAISRNSSLHIKGTHQLNKIFWYMKHLGPLSTEQVSKNSSHFWNTLKNAFEVQKLVLTRGRRRRQWPHIEGRRRRQWLQIEGRRRRQWLQIEGRHRRQLVCSVGPWRVLERVVGRVLGRVLQPSLGPSKGPTEYINWRLRRPSIWSHWHLRRP